MNNPYTDLEPSSFWKSGVAQRHRTAIGGLWKPKFPISPSNIVTTYGSCFAQHIGKALLSKGYAWKNFENAPDGCSVALQKKYNYGIFSSRTGNIYTTSLLRQWMDWSIGQRAVPDELWEEDGRFYDPFRPAIEPLGFFSREELRASRARTIASFGHSIRSADVLVFTLGLTESWFNAKDGYEYPMCPGTLHGEFDASAHVFRNQGFESICAALTASIEMMRGVNPDLRILLTVSPVPLTATKSGQHILVATTHSKSILRAVAGQISQDLENVDYFPSYEIITNPFFEDDYFEANKRSVRPSAVDHVMDNFFFDLNGKPVFAEIHQPLAAHPTDAGLSSQQRDEDDLCCEEAFLAAFAPGQG